MIIKNLLKNSYIPYSRNPNRAIIESTDGNFYPGVRVENIVFPLTISAVQNAVYCCLSEGETPRKLFVDGESDALAKYWIDEYNLDVDTANKDLGDNFTNIFLGNVDIDETLQSLFRKTRAGHSQFPVSCLLKGERGFVSGVNIENRSWTGGLCAERVAIGKAFSYGISRFEEIHICSKGGGYCSPCGACRQVLTEHLPHSKVYLHHPDGTTSEHYCSHLLPNSFQSSSLKE